MKFKVSIMSTLLCGLLLLPAAALAAPAKVAVIPFTIHSDRDYTFLQKGIVEMLTSRLSAPEKVQVIDPVSTEQAVAKESGLSGDKKAAAVGAKLNADYAIYGSLTVLGESVSIDAKLLDISGAKPPLTFFKQSQGMGQVIPQINQMANDINAQVFGVQPPAEPMPATAAPSAVVPLPTLPPPTAGADVHMHPEKLLKAAQRLTAAARHPPARWWPAMRRWPAMRPSRRPTL